MLRLVDPVPVAYCMPWHARGWSPHPEHVGTCMYCNRDVAVPEPARGKYVACIYCAMDRGMIHEMEAEPDMVPLLVQI